MALNANEVQGKAREYHPMDAGTYPARLVAVIDMGLQDGGQYMGQKKDPVRKLATTYEFVDEFMLDEDGQPDPKKPRWVTEDFPFYNLAADKAKSTKRYLTLDPTRQHGGDWTKLLNTPVMATVVHNQAQSGKHKGRIFENIGGISLPRAKDADKMAPLVNEPFFFDLDNPTPETWKRVPRFLQERIKGNLEFSGSALQKMLATLESEPAKKDESKQQAKAKPAKKQVEEEDDEQPY